MNRFIVCIRSSCVLACCVNRALVSCILYADDVISLAVSTREMLHVLHQTSKELGLLQSNASNSYCAVFGTPPTSRPQLCLGSDLMEGSSSIKLVVKMSVLLQLKLILTCSVRGKFYTACNSVSVTAMALMKRLSSSFKNQNYCLPLLPAGLREAQAAGITFTHRPKIRFCTRLVALIHVKLGV